MSAAELAKVEGSYDEKLDQLMDIANQILSCNVSGGALSLMGDFPD